MDGAVVFRDRFQCQRGGVFAGGENQSTPCRRPEARLFGIEELPVDRRGCGSAAVGSQLLGATEQAVGESRLNFALRGDASGEAKVTVFNFRGERVAMAG